MEHNGQSLQSDWKTVGRQLENQLVHDQKPLEEVMQVLTVEHNVSIGL